MFVFFRAITYACLFIGFVLIYFPARVLAWAGVSPPAEIEWPQGVGLIVGTFGALIAIWCVLALARLGKGTPAPFDPPRKLVVRGPYRFVRNPMYIGATTALIGAAIFYRVAALTGFAALFFLTAHLFAVLYEEPTLKRSFGGEYDTYCRTVSRWLPRPAKPLSAQDHIA
jgi:protein-S-isoprenylcysteine O-methyltransferase Ste14